MVPASMSACLSVCLSVHPILHLFVCSFILDLISSINKPNTLFTKRHNTQHNDVLYNDTHLKQHGAQ